MAAYLPPGWPAGVHPPGSEGFERTAVAWLLDVVPPDFRLYGVLRRHPVALAAMAKHHVAACVEGARDGYRTARTELGDDLPPPGVEAVLAAYRKEGKRLVATASAVDLILRALRGQAPHGEAPRGQAPRGEAPQGERRRAGAARGEAPRQGDALRGDAQRRADPPPAEIPRAEDTRRQADAPPAEIPRGKAGQSKAAGSKAARNEAARPATPRGKAQHGGKAPRDEAAAGRGRTS